MKESCNDPTSNIVDEVEFIKVQGREIDQDLGFHY